jgi:hypothetical protein
MFKEGEGKRSGEFEHPPGIALDSDGGMQDTSTSNVLKTPVGSAMWAVDTYGLRVLELKIPGW